MTRRYWFVSSMAIALAIIACVVLPAPATHPAPTPPDTQDPENVPPGSAAAPNAMPEGTIRPGDYNRTIRSGGMARTYILHVPSGYDGSRPLPLVFVLHGLGGDAAGMVPMTGWSDQADQATFFVAYIDGTGARRGFNDGLMPDLGLTANDVGFVRDLSGHLQQQLRVDDKRIYATGFSNGAMMSYRLGSELSDVLAGIGAVAGTIGMRAGDGSMLQISEPGGPMPVVIIHGRLDPNVPYGGGRGIGRYAFSVADAVTFWTKANGCTGNPLEASNTGNVLVTNYRTCLAGSEVLLYTIVNSAHEWPTAQGHTRFSATDAIWSFFSSHSRP